MNSLRPYQQETIQKMLWSLTLEGNSVVVLPTGSGKTHVIAEFVNRLRQPILILVPSKELLEQDLSKLEAVVPKEEIGIFSASLNSKQVKKYTLATIQSAYKHPEQFSHYQVVIIDECHQLNPKNLMGMYNIFFRQIGSPKVIGMTATPFRMDFYYKKLRPDEIWGFGGYGSVETIHTLKIITRYKDRFWNRIIHVVQVQDLIQQGFLSPLTYIDSQLIDEKKLTLNKSKSDYNLEDFEYKFEPFIHDTANLVKNIKHKSILLFCATIRQGEKLQKLIPNSAMISSETPKKEREKIIQDFREGKLRVAINVGILLIGFNLPALEAIVVLRPTRSLLVWTQLLGRGMRIFDGKKTCYVYDLVGNLKILGKAESMKIEKIKGLWNVTTDTELNGWHYKNIYSYFVK